MTDAGHTGRRVRGSGPIVLVMVVATGLASCGGGQNDGSTDPASPVVEESQRQVYDMDLEQQTSYARTDLATRLGVPEDELRLLEAAVVSWRDGSMGCPLPDRAYMQVITPGVLVRLAHGKSVYEYHGSRTGRPFLCEPPATIEPPASVDAPIRGHDDGT